MLDYEPKSVYGKTSCDFCGNSPTNHFFAYINNTISVSANKFSELWVAQYIYYFFSKLFDLFSFVFEKIFFSTLCFLRVAEMRKDIGDKIDLRSRMIWLEAKRREIPMEQFFILDHATDWYRAYLKGAWCYFISIPIPPKLYVEDSYWIDDKDILKKRLKAGGVPTPESATAMSKKKALAIFDVMKKPIIVKPRSGSRGRHTTTFITKKEDFLVAFKRAKQIGYYVQIEEHLMGNVCRGTVIDGVLRGFLKAESPKVIGNGISTIQELIEEKNKNKPNKIGDVVVKQELIEFTRRQGYELGDILPNDTVLPLLSRTGRLFGGRTKEMANEVHPKLKKYLEKAGEIVGVPLVGFDLIIQNPESDPDKERWGIIEANSLPFIDLHEFSFEGKPANVASYIWDLWEKSPHISRN